jgi:hypothetical protein
MSVATKALGAAVVGHYRRGSKLIAFDEQRFDSRTALARRLAPIVGRSVKAVVNMLAKHNYDAERVIAAMRSAR